MATKQKSGLYRTKVKIGVGPDGKDIVKWVSGKTRKELEDAKREVIEHYITGARPNEDKLFGEMAVQWYNARKAPKLTASSTESYRTALNKDILPVFGNRNCRAITVVELQEFINGFGGMSGTKITYIAAALKGVFEYACAHNVLAENPMMHVVKPSAAPPEEKVTLTDEQRRKIEELCKAEPRARLLALMYYMGLRPGEARGLQWGDIDWAANTVHVQRDIDYKAGGKVGNVKTRKSNRVIPMPKELRDILGGSRGLPDVFIVQGAKGGALAKTSSERLWVELMQKCDMVEPVSGTCYHSTDIRAHWRATITPHCIRHNYATLCWERGLDPYTTMRLMGHSSIKTTMDIYTHLNEMQMARISQKIDGLFEKQSCTKVAQAEENWWVVK